MEWRIFSFVACVVLLFQSRTGLYADARLFWDQALSLWDRHTLALPYMGFEPLANAYLGKNYAIYPLGFSLVCIPFYVLSKLLGHIPGVPGPSVLFLAPHGCSTFLLALVSALFFRIVRRQGAALWAAVALSLLLGLGTILTVYGRHTYSEVLQAVLLLWIVDACFRLLAHVRLRTALEVGVAAGALLNTKNVNAFVVMVVFSWLAWQFRRRRAEFFKISAAVLAPFLALVGLLVWVNFIKTGTLTESGYAVSTNSTSQFSGRPWDAIWGFLFSPGRSLFVFSPPLILGVLAFRSYRARFSAHAALLILVVLAVGLPHSFYHSWYGGPFWGPRYMVPLTPIVLLPAATWLPDALSQGRRWLRRFGFGAVAAAGVYVQAMGCLIYWDYFRKMVEIVGEGRDATWTYVSTVFIPAFSSVVGHSWLAWHFLTGDRDLTTTVPWRIETAARPDFNADFDIPIDFWWKGWLPAYPTLSWIILAALLLGIGFSGFLIVRGLRREGGSVPRT